MASGLVSVTHAGAPVGPEDESTCAIARSVLGDIERAIEPFADRIRELGGRVVADIPVSLQAVRIKVHNLPPDLADDVLDRCYKQVSGG